MGFIWHILLICAQFALASGLGCIDDDGNAVDWFYAYKLPENSSQSQEAISWGDGFVYLLSSGSASSWTFSDSAAGYDDSMMGRTLHPIYLSGRDDLVYVLYNDEKPDDSTSSSRGHTKGVVVLDQDSGFWLIHSVPKYPPVTADGYSYPSSGCTYGQTYLCITFNTADADVIGTQFHYTLPWLYDTNMPSWSQAALPELYAYVTNDEKVTSEPWYNVIDFKSAGGDSFKSFAKHTNWGQDLYGDLVAPTLQSDLTVETWNHGSDQIPSVCSPYTVKNVDEVYISAVDYSFKATSDHSKWAAAPSDAADPWVCVGDINRMESQEKRAGGTVCASSTRPWKAFSSSAKTLQPCP